MGSSRKKVKPVTIGHHYYLNVHFALGASGIQELQEIRIGDREAWKGSLNGAGSALVSQVDLFGGEKREGGVCGIVDFMPGDDTQPVNLSISTALNEAVGSPHTPNYRGVTTVFMKGFDGLNLSGTPWFDLDPGTLPADSNQYSSVTNMSSIMDHLSQQLKFNYRVKLRHQFSFCWSGMNPYFKVPWFKVRRNFDEWYPSKANINGNSNPAHIYYEILTNHDWGMGESTSNIDDVNFTAAADTFFDEGLGLSFKWDNQQSFSDIIEFVNDHCNANLYEDRLTGKWCLKLVRDDYDHETIPELNEANCTVTNISGKTLSDTVNEVVVSFSRLEDGTQDTVTAQDLANYVVQGRINSQKRDYPAITDPTIASKLAFRDLATLSKPLKKITVEADRSMYNVYPGDPVKLVWPREGIDGLVFRVGNMDFGGIQEGKIMMELIEDVFALPANVYTAVQNSQWVSSEKSPEAIVDYKRFELSYYEVYTNTTSADRVDWPEDVVFMGVAAGAPNNDSKSFTLYDEVAQDEVAEGGFSHVFEIAEGVGRTQTSILMNVGVYENVFALAIGGVAWLNNELVEITSYDSATKIITVNRGCIDTVLTTHSAGDKLFLYYSDNPLVGATGVVDETNRVTFEEVEYRFLTQTTKNTLPIGLAPLVDQFTAQGRMHKPYPPGRVSVNAEYLPDTIVGEFDLTWANKNKEVALAGIPTFTDFGINLAAGDENRIVLLNEDNEEITTLVTTGQSFTYSDAIEKSDLAKTVHLQSGIFTDSVNTYDPLDDTWVDQLFTPSFYDGTHIHFQGEAQKQGDAYSYNVFFYMGVSDTVLDFNSINKIPSLYTKPIQGNGRLLMKRHGNPWVYHVATATAKSADTEWTSYSDSNLTDCSIMFDGTQFVAIDTELAFAHHLYDIYVSPDGDSFTKLAENNIKTTNSFKPYYEGLVYFNGKYYLPGVGTYNVSAETYSDPILVSTDLVNFSVLNFPVVWDDHYHLISGTLNKYQVGTVKDIVSFGTNLIVQLDKYHSNNTTTNFLYTTDDEGTTWSTLTPDTNNPGTWWDEFHEFNGKLYLLKTEGVIAETSDLSAWTVTDLIPVIDPLLTVGSISDWVVAGSWVFFKLDSAELNHPKVYKTQDFVTFTEISEINANVLAGGATLEHRLNSTLTYSINVYDQDGNVSNGYTQTVTRVGYGYSYGESYGGK